MCAPGSNDSVSLYRDVDSKKFPTTREELFDEEDNDDDDDVDNLGKAFRQTGNFQ